MTTGPAPTARYAPQVRLVDLATGKVVGATKGQGNEVAIAPDVVSCRVTLTCHGVGQVQIVLNNQRFVDGKPVWPPWKYNDISASNSPSTRAEQGLANLAFGRLIRVDFRYGAGTWMKMIVAQVNDMQFSFPASGGAQLTITGEDPLCRMKVKPTQDTNHERKQEEDIVGVCVNAAYTGEATAKPSYTADTEDRGAQGRTEPMRTLRHNKGQTYFQFVSEMAERLDYELYMDFLDVRAQPGTGADVGGGPISLQNELALKFRLARSQKAVAGEKRDGVDPADDAAAPAQIHYELRWARDLLEFTPKFKVFEIPTSAEAIGTNHGRRARSRQQLTAAELGPLMNTELPASPNYSGVTMTNALDARAAYFDKLGSGAESNESSSGSNLDASRLKIQAKARFLKKVREFMTAETQVVGLPRLRPGQFVDIQGLRPPFDGYYYVTKTVHALDGSGYKTQLSLRRPGMMPPDRYLPPTPPAAAPGGTP